MRETARRSFEIPPGAAFVGLVAVLATVSGCAAVNDVAYGRSEATYDNVQTLIEARGAAPDWLPADAREIERSSSTRADDTESLLFTSDSALAGCETVERQSAPTMDIDAAPDVYTIDQVELCGTWAVAESDGTYYAWTPATEADAATP